MSQLAAVVQTSNPGAIVQLFLLDATSVGGEVVHFVQSSEANEPVSFNGITFTPVDVEMTGFETAGTGALPTPHLKLANTNGVFQGMLNAYGDLLGCQLIRIRTFERFLDGRPDADSTAFYGPDTFRIEQKVKENPIYIEWALSASIDEEGKLIPGRVVLRDTCMWRYRVFAGGGFLYDKAQCPYTGSNYFDEFDQPVSDAAKDKPSRRLTCCKNRFGADAALPFGGFPGAARVRPTS